MKQIINLNGTWQLKEETKKTFKPMLNDWINVDVPGNIETSLSENGILPKDLYYGDNILKAQCVENSCWWYRKKFAFTRELRDEVNLVFNGLDLFTVIYFNGQEIGKTANMFRQYKFDIKKFIKQGENEILIKFISTKNETDKLLKKYPDYWTIFYQGSTLVRKTQCHFGWDWAPKVITRGIWEDVYIENYSHNTINDVYVETQIDGQLCFRVRLNTFLTGKTLSVAKDGTEKGSAEAESLRLRESLAGKIIKVTVKDNNQTFTSEAPATGVNNFVNLKLKKPRLWWPCGMGNPTLYEYSVYLLDENKILDSYSSKFGIRKIEIEENAISSKRSGFTIKINNEPVFCKGGNWVPTDCFPGRTNNKTYERLIKNAIEANFNMLRVWGGGIYEKGIFYEECDKHGIMVWQDFANACGHPPDDQMWFLENILPEAEYQVKRLRNHPSIVIWCGGNEIHNPWFFSENPPGKNLLHYYLRGVVGDLTVNTPYIYSSPHSKSDMGRQLTSGDAHESSRPKKANISYKNFRDRISNSTSGFSSEIAVIGPSPIESLEKCLNKKDLLPPSDTVILHFGKHPDPKHFSNHVLDQLGMANELINNCETAEQFINNAMMAHSEMTTEEIGSCRSKKFECSGAMIWMYNECWPNSNWALVDYYGYKKPAYYAAKKAFSPISIAFTCNGNSYSLFLINDTLKNVKYKLDFKYADIDGNIFWSKIFDKNCPANSSTKITTVSKKLTNKKNAFLRAVCKVGTQIIETNFFPQLWKDVAFEKPDFDYKVIKKNTKINDCYETIIKIHSKNYSRFLNIIAQGIEPQNYSIHDNYFDLIPGQYKTIKLKSTSIIKNLIVESLMQN